MAKRKTLAFLGVATAVAIIAAVAFFCLRAGTPRLLNTSAAAKLPQHATKVSPLRLATGLVPPTNRWFTALVFSKTPQPVFAYPLSYRPTTTGFELDAPIVTGSPSAVFASHRPTIKVNLGADSSMVSAYDDLSVTVAHQFNGSTIASTKLTEGSPFAFVTMANADKVEIATAGQISSPHSDCRIITIGDQVFGVISDGVFTTDGGVVTLQIPAAGRFTLFALPKGADLETYYAAAHHPITQTSSTYRQAGNQLITTYRIATTGGPTLFATNPNLPIDHPATVPGKFDTLLGVQTVVTGNEFTSSEAVVAPPNALDLSRISPTDRATLVAQINADARSLTFTATDTYFGGKELYRAANLLQLAHQLDQPDAATLIDSKLKTQLMMWFDPSGQTQRGNRYFYYDSTYRGVVGATASFGSEAFNDHHYHFGYFIYASAILAKYDHDFYSAASPMVNVLVGDIASPTSSGLFPKLRLFDVYAGHSWASGTGDFADGNNQESSSEAVNAWYAVYLWAQVAHNPALQQESQWLYQLESDSAASLWLRQTGTVVPGSAYIHSFVSLVWGGKLDYSTFFSARPQDLLGIQLIPMSPGQQYLAAEGNSAISRNLSSVAPTPSDFTGAFSDYLIMYQALGNPSQARANLANFNPSDLDSANSQSYLDAWVFSR